MVNLGATAAAGVVVVFFAVALAAMTGGSYRIAGVLFLSASVVIYLRETYLVES